jgi:iron complex transport system substrate-binding protein
MPRAWLLLLFALLLAGCQPEVVALGGKEYSPPAYVVSLSPSTTEVVASNGNTGQLRGRTKYCNYPPYLSKLPEVRTYGAVKPDYEKLAGDKPNLIVYEKSLYSDAEIAKIKSLGIPVFEFHSNTLDEFILQLKELGDTLNSPLNMSQYIDRINAERRLAASKAPKIAPKVAALSGSMMNGTKTFVADVIRVSGGEPVGPDVNRFVELNPEALIQADPDIILLSVDIAALSENRDKQSQVATAAVEKFRADPRFKGLKAVKDNTVFPVDGDVMLRQGARVEYLITAISQVVQTVAGK